MYRPYDVTRQKNIAVVGLVDELSGKSLVRQSFSTEYTNIFKIFASDHISMWI